LRERGELAGSLAGDEPRSVWASRTIPSPPALLTAEASSAYPTHCIPPWTTGTAGVSMR
jgi:hypothetical protein